LPSESRKPTIPKNYSGYVPNAKKEAPILLEAQEMLRKWEAGDEKVVSLWRTMNDWVLKGFDETYKMMGI